MLGRHCIDSARLLVDIESTHSNMLFSSPKPEVMIRLSLLEIPPDTAMLELTMVLPLTRAQRDTVDGVVSMLEEALFLNISPAPEIDCAYCWLLHPNLAEQYVEMFRSYLDFLGIRCDVVEHACDMRKLSGTPA